MGGFYNSRDYNGLGKSDQKLMTFKVHFLIIYKEAKP